MDVLSKARSGKSGTFLGVTYRGLVDWYNQLEDEYYPDDGQLAAMESRSFLGSNSGNNDDVRDSLKSNLTRTPTTRSDPLEFNLSSSNKENEVRNFPRLPQQAPSTSAAASSSHNQQASFSSLTLSQSSTNSSISEAQYENYPQQHKLHNKFDPRLAQSGRFVSQQPGTSTSTEPFEPNVLQVFAAYETGLASGTSVKLNVTHSTTAREVIDLVIKQLNMAVILKGKEGPIYENDKLKNFCLVAVIGNRERCLRDDFKPLNLQNPWTKGKLFVRMKNDLLAAIEHISRHSTML